VRAYALLSGSDDVQVRQEITTTGPLVASFAGSARRRTFRSSGIGNRLDRQFFYDDGHHDLGF
jgi:hypothetical protein